MDKILEDDKNIEVLGARVFNLKNIDVTIPRYKLSVITGLSGSGKSSLAFSTVYAEGQRRYIETFSAYARHFIGNIERPDVDKISGLSPVIAIEQKTVSKNPRSSVGTVTEIYDFFRLLYARAGEAYSYLSGEKMVRYTDEQILKLILEKFDNQAVILLAPVVKNRKGHYKEQFESLRKKGYMNVRIDGKMCGITLGMKLDRYKNHDIEAVVDKLIISEKDEPRLKKSIQNVMRLGDGVMMLMEKESGKIHYFSSKLMCPQSGLSYNETAPHNFSFNTPKGACPKCNGLGTVNQIDTKKIIPNPKLSIAEGGILPLGKEKKLFIFQQIAKIGEKYGFDLKTPIENIEQEGLDEILNGSSEPLTISYSESNGVFSQIVNYEGLIHYIELHQDETATVTEQKWAEKFYRPVVCPECKGARLNREALHYRIDNKNIAEISQYPLDELKAWIDGLIPKLSPAQKAIASEIIKEISTRLNFLLDVGLNYLSLGRATESLSGGEGQRIRLATQIGSQLVNVLYILDEPSIGLHQRDNVKLIHSLKNLRDMGNSVIVVEHDEEMMLSSDYIVDMGPRAGRLGGQVVFQGTPQDLLKTNTLTASYLNGMRKIEFLKEKERRVGNGKFLKLSGCTGNNLKNVDIKIPLGMFICIVGVSGSGKSSLINRTLQPILSKHFYRSIAEPLPYKKIEGIENIDKIIEVNQSPIGRSPRSNPVTYTNIFAEIRNLFAGLTESKVRGYKAGRFSFNVAGGRCSVCDGNGYKTLEMNFLPDVIVPCEECMGKRYNRETLEVRFKGKSIADVLDMTINQSVEFFENIPNIVTKLKMLQEVGLGYIKLGQSSTTLSGGESQRVKLAAELAKRDTGKTLYVLDEPTTGLHFEDIKVLLKVLNRLVANGNTVIIIEHNLDVVKCADYVFELGPDAGKLGGEIVAQGTPEQICKNKKSVTAPFLRKLTGKN
ncbi:MAG: excinuclease ABC subunit UvrA [Prevotellaceae bacterium]|jgi:excinuclease ABC subunit A|nr:excinuclease ABC subunit UvrA [Prevotellaceae bacterium]